MMTAMGDDWDLEGITRGEDDNSDDFADGTG